MINQIQDAMPEQEPLGWPRWLKEGDQYFTAVAEDGKRSRFGTNIRYNLLSMSLESYIMAMTDFHHTLPDNHTYSDLLDGLQRVMPVDEELKKRILKYENIQSICSIEQYHRDNEPEEEDLKNLREAVLQIQKMAYELCCA
ncbi:MAG: hypothetical protein ABIJ31_08930 [Pseudomonadota bacterium]